MNLIACLRRRRIVSILRHDTLSSGTLCATPKYWTTMFEPLLLLLLFHCESSCTSTNREINRRSDLGKHLFSCLSFHVKPLSDNRSVFSFCSGKLFGKTEDWQAAILTRTDSRFRRSQIEGISALFRANGAHFRRLLQLASSLPSWWLLHKGLRHRKQTTVKAFKRARRYRYSILHVSVSRAAIDISFIVRRGVSKFTLRQGDVFPPFLLSQSVSQSFSFYELEAEKFTTDNLKTYKTKVRRIQICRGQSTKITLHGLQSKIV